MCDQYQPNTVLLCKNGDPFSIYSCGEFTCFEGQCTEITTPEPAVTPLFPELCPTPGVIVAVTPECKSSIFCTGSVETSVVNDCKGGEYYDEDESGCFPAPPTACGNCEGSCPDPSNCTVYHICEDKVSLTTTVCTDATDKLINYDPSTRQCIDDATKCAKITKCDFSNLATTIDTTNVSTAGGSEDTSAVSTAGSTEDTSTVSTAGGGTTPTSKPETCSAANVNKRYPDPTDCKK